MELGHLPKVTQQVHESDTDIDGWLILSVKAVLSHMLL